MKQQSAMSQTPHQPSAPEPTAAPVASPDSARLNIRYRPISDVLIGVVDLPASIAPGPVTRSGGKRTGAGGSSDESQHTSELVDVTDADTRLSWRTALSGPYAGQSFLESFEVVHALARWESDGLQVLPHAVAAWCASEATHFTTAAGLEHNPTVRLGYRGQASTELALSEVVRSAGGPTTLPQGTQESALQVARSLESLADSMEAAASSASRARFHDRNGAEYVEDLALEEQRVNRFTSLARELACTLADHDALPAPGTSAAVRRTVRGGLPLAPRERHSLLETLRMVDDAQRWPTVVEQLNTLAQALAPRHSDTPEPAAAPRTKKAPRPNNPDTNNPNPERQDPA